MIKILFLIFIIILPIIFCIFYFKSRRVKLLNDELITLIIGQKRAGKSTLAAALAYQCYKEGIPVYSNYPIKYCKRLPIVRDSHGREVLDKYALYDMDLYNAVLLIDESAGIWNARSFKSFTEDDSNFFNCLGHTNTRVYLICQFIDMIDLNLRRSAGEVWFVRRGHFGFSRVEKSLVSVEKVRNLDEQVLEKGYDVIDFKVVMSDKMFKKRFFRPRWYNNFDSYYVDKTYNKLNSPDWSTCYQFDTEKKWYHKFLKS